MAKKPLPSPEVLRQLLRYEPDTGKLFWRERTPDMFEDGGPMQTPEAACKSWNTRFAGKEALTANRGGGYRHGTIFLRTFRAHRVAWAIHHCEWPQGEIDHINHDATDNRIENLRVVTQRENMCNQTLRQENTSGHCGVHWDDARSKWFAAIGVNGKRVALGRFTDKADAIAARKAAEIKYNFHPNHGKASPDNANT